jgi:predicted alpha/beta-fold hydrolase
MSVVLWLLLLVVLLLVFWHVYPRSNRIVVEVNPNGLVAQIVARMQSLKKPYYPTPQYTNGFTQTIRGMRSRPRSSILKDQRREEYTLPDGGVVALDFFLPNPPSDSSPFVIISGTLGGGTREPCVCNLAATFVRRGWRVVVANGRGCSGMKFTNDRVAVAIDYDDITEVVAHIVSQYHPPHLFLAGFSMGSMQTIAYGVANGANVDGIALVSHMYNLLRGSKQLEKPLQKFLFAPPIMKGLMRMLEKNTFLGDWAKDLKRVKSMREFDDKFTARIRGYPSHVEYYAAGDIYEKILNVKVPTLILGADNDPFIADGCAPIEEARRSEMVVFAHTAEGGHVSFPSGRDGKGSLIDSVLPDWFESIVAEKSK